MHFHTSLALLSASLLYHVTYASMAPVSIVMTMIIRDEEVNLRSNLHLWNGIIDKYVFLIDDRTVDQSEAAIRSILHDKSSYVITPFHFEGFGQARTESLSLAWERFPTASHVWIADPDWRPDVNTISKSDLEQSAETYEFIIFDRNGYTERTSNWLLRHRAGLRMKYHLHEVLDIDRSRNTSDVYGLWLGWSVHEVEQSGSWHSTVGHGHSMSAERFLFDISLLEKDLSTYGHDAHTHFYLGVSHYGYVQASVLSGSDAVFDAHIRAAVDYLMMRTTHTYSFEHTNERLSALFALGHLYAVIEDDITNAEHYLLLCHDLSPKHPTCLFALSKLYFTFGLMSQMKEAANKLLFTEYDRRGPMARRIEWNCEIPKFLLELFLLPTLQSELTSDLALYLLILKYMLSTKECSEHSLSLDASTQRFFDHMRSSFGLIETPIDDSLCSSNLVQGILRKEEISLHPCVFQVENARCDKYSQKLPPTEMYQIPVFGEYIGAAIIPDIVHHVYGGDARPVLADKQRTIFRVLFAEHFSDHNVFNLASVISNDDFDVEITVLASPDAIRRIRAVFAACDLRLVSRITFVPLQENKTYSESLSDHVVGSGYDYIEYNGGASRSEKYVDELLDLRKLLSSRGSMGVTFFSANDHLDVIRRTLRNVNASSHPPFSVEPVRLTKHLLESLGLSAYVNDADLTSFLSNITQCAFSREDISELMSTLDLKILSWLPTAYSHPFDELPHHSVQVYRSHGMSEKDVVESVIGGFRYTVYASRSDAILGKVKFENLLVRHHMRVLDRHCLGDLLKDAPFFAASGESLVLKFAPLSMTGGVVDLVLLPDIVFGIAAIRESATLGEMESRFINHHRGAAMDISSVDSLYATLGILEALNLITYWSDFSSTLRIDSFEQLHLTLELHQLRFSSAGVLNSKQLNDKSPCDSKKLKLSTWYELMSSIRNPKCALIENPSDQLPCFRWDKEPETNNRRFTSALSITSRHKLQFDIAQLLYIAKHNVISSRIYFTEVIPHLKDILATTSHHSSNALVTIPDTSPYLNRVLRLHSNVTVKSLFYSDVYSYFGNLSTVLTENDFVVIDNAMPTATVSAALDMMLLSTIWFDAGNGVAYFAHADEGLIFTLFLDLGQQLEKILLDQYPKVELVRYFAVAMSENIIGSSPIISGEENTIAVIVWLQAHSGHGGSRIRNMASCRADKKAFKINDDGMWMHGNSFDFHPSLLCPAADSETIPAISNRLIILAPGNSVSFEQYVPSMRRDTFEDSTMVAVVYMFEISRNL